MKIKSVFFLIAIIFSQLVFSQAVVGPSSGFVVGPADSSNSSMDLNNKDGDVKLKNKSSDEANVQKAVFQFDSTSGTKLSCKYDEKNAKSMSLEAGISRMNLISATISMLDNPSLAQSLGSQDNSMSVGMLNASETLGASQLTANEMEAEKRLKEFQKKCENLSKNVNAEGELQLYSYSCIVYHIINHLTDLYSDSDTLYQKTTELSTVLNQAMAENIQRDAKIAEQKKKIGEVNKDLKSALDKLKKAQSDLKKAEAAVKEADKKLQAANQMQCEKKCDEQNVCTEDCSAKDAAVAAATKDLDKAKADKDKAEKDLKKAADDLLKLLKDKLSYEAGTVLALLTGTIHGDANGQDVHFKVNGNDYTLLNSDKAISEMIGLPGYHGHWGLYQEQNPNGSQEDFMNKIAEGDVNNFFSRLAQNLNDNKDPNKEYYSLFGDKISSDQFHSQVFPISGGSSQKEIGMALDQFVNVGPSGVDNLATLAMAIGDYQQSAGDKQLAYLQSMKTPQSRMDYLAKKIDENKNLNLKVREMISNNLCYLEVMLNLYRKTYDGLGMNKMSEAKIDPFLVYFYKFNTKPYYQKLDDGYVSKVKVVDIRTEFEKQFQNSTGLNKK